MAAGTDPVTQKCLLPVAGRPFLHHVLHALSTWRVDQVLLLGGHRGDDLITFVRDLPPQPFELQCRVENRPLGTVGAVRMVGNDLDEKFLVALGDVYPPPGDDVGRRLDMVLDRTDALAVLASASEHESLDQGNLTVDGELVVRYDKTVRAPLIDRGLRLMTRTGLREHHGDSDTAYFGGLANEGLLAHCTIPGRVFDIGTPTRLRRVRDAFERGVTDRPSTIRGTVL